MKNERTNTTDPVDNDRFEELLEESRKSNVPVIPVIILGIIVLSLGIHCVNFVLDIFYEEMDVVGTFIIIMSFMLMVLAFNSIRQCILTEGILFLLAGFIGIIMGIVLVVPDAKIVPSMLLLMMGLVVSGIIFYSREEYVMSISSFGFAIALIAAVVWTQLVTGIILTVIGSILIVMGSVSMVGIKSRLSLHESTVAKIERHEFPEVFVMTAGTLIFANLSFLIGINIADPSGSGSSYLYMKILLGIMTMSFGMYALRNKIVGEGSLMLIIGLSSLTGALCVSVCGTSPHLLDILFGLMLLPAVACMLKEKEYLIGITALLLAMVLIMEPFWEKAELIEYLVAVAKILAMYYAVSSWYRYDTGKSVDILSRFKKKGASDE